MNLEPLAAGAARKGPRPSLGTHRDYSRWTIEELRALAMQLQIRDAASKSRPELVEFFAAPAAPGRRRA